MEEIKSWRVKTDFGKQLCIVRLLNLLAAHLTLGLLCKMEKMIKKCKETIAKQ